jgi:hypothetical protein
MAGLGCSGRIRGRIRGSNIARQRTRLGTNLEQRFSSEVANVLRASGWQPGRRTSARQLDAWATALGGGFEQSSAARSVLEEFGGLKIQQAGAGLEIARQDVEFDPLLALHEDDRFRELQALTGRVFPLGEVWGGMSFFAISEEGRVFAVMSAVDLLGDTIDQALEVLIRGLRPQRVGP